MDERLEKALEISNLMITYSNQKRALKEKYLNDCIFYHNGGTFTLNTSLITYVKVLNDLGYRLDIVLIDDNQTPIMISDLSEFQNEITEKFTRATNQYYFDFELLKKNRSVESFTL